MLIENEVQIVVQINGKKRGIIKATRDIKEKDLLNLLKKDIKIKKYLIEKEIQRQIYIKKSIWSFQTSSFKEEIMINQKT